MRPTDHLDSEALILFLDGELTEQESTKVQFHLSCCETCRSKRDELAGLSARVGALVASQPSGEKWSDWPDALASFDGRTSASEANPSKVMKRFGWGMALAATLAVGVVLAPKDRFVKRTPPVTVASPAVSSSIEVDGENFIALPYSNPDLPINASRIVEMQVPVSSLAAAGILLQPYPDGTGDRTVAANVLLGLDGQPLGVHVLSVD